MEQRNYIEQIINAACITTNSKYYDPTNKGVDQTAGAISAFITNGNPQHFSGSQNRANLKELGSVAVLAEVLKHPIKREAIFARESKGNATVLQRNAPTFDQLNNPKMTDDQAASYVYYMISSLPMPAVLEKLKHYPLVLAKLIDNFVDERYRSNPQYLADLDTEYERYPELLGNINKINYQYGLETMDLQRTR